ncbi:seipin-2 [Ricinus communis]|uniref:seipin-2 n=1 Tax=Ricinus communis TaxID=3988 RepID=UPI00077268BF|nr:seipin-2 [Ricinus communis]|eukprot:XP_015576658.1 seipin-2 [Ricinus communis]
MDSLNQNDEDCFFDALEEFPIYDCNVRDQSSQSTSDSTLCDPSPEVSSTSTTTLRRRRGISCTTGLKDSRPESSCISSDITHTNDSRTRYNSKEKKRHPLSRDLKENEKNLDTSESTRRNRERVDSVKVDNDKQIEARVGDSITGDANLLESLAVLVIKAIGLQFNLFVNFITFPIWGLYCFYMFVIDPFVVMRRSRGFLIQKLVYLWNLISGFFSPLIIDWLKEQKSMWKLLLRFGCGMFWSCYVCVILCGLLVSSIVVSGFFMRYLVENPVEIKDQLDFDYTQNSPAAFVPIMSCGGIACGVNCEEQSLGPRIIPPNHKLQANIILTLPESGYNRNLGIFQVRIDFLAADGKVLSSKRQPCMLKFISGPIRVLLTFFKVAPLVTGYMSESQTLKVKIQGFTEMDMPTSCLKVIIEQRAEYRPGAGIPEIYDASLILESELPVFKRLIWCWKKTLFLWIIMVLFTIQLLFTLICCRPVIIPRTRSRNVPAGSNSLPAISQS